MEQKKEFNIDIPEDVAQGSYSNLAIITHSGSEFIFDFVRIMPGITKPKVQQRIIMTPEHAKRLLNALQDNIAKYESTFGPINLMNKNNLPPMPITGFGNNPAQA